mmetsp:Transcript_39043/g.90870  ORF Transcript_39043/g.90870 Transcript_39043/m.90870 type:complete len:234 (-) Transcript_39043:176-877(-)
MCPGMTVGLKTTAAVWTYTVVATTINIIQFKMKFSESIKMFHVMAIAIIAFGFQGYRIARLLVLNASSVAELNEIKPRIDILILNVKDSETIRALDPEGDESVTFDRFNTASGKDSSGLGVSKNITSGSFSLVSGWSDDSALVDSSSISGGFDNTVVSGGFKNTSYGLQSSVSSRMSSNAGGKYSYIVDALTNTATGLATYVADCFKNNTIGQRLPTADGRLRRALEPLNYIK